MIILIGGDVVPTTENFNLFYDGNIRGLMGEELSHHWFACDHRIFNLECPVTNSAERISKNGPFLVADERCFKGIQEMKPSVVLLSNNHIMDAGRTGLTDLLTHLKAANIPYIGAGDNIDSIDTGYVIEDETNRVGIYVCCDHEFSAATTDDAGAYPFSYRCFNEIERFSKTVNYTIVIYHGGKEYYRYPSPDLQDRCRGFVEAGADLVLCQHSHCIGSEERYEGSIILYGQGNFIFNKKHDEYWKTSLLVEIETEDGFSVKYLPLVQSEKGTELADMEEAEEIFTGLRDRSASIQEAGFVDREFSVFSSSIITSYLYAFAGWNRYFSAIDKKLFNGFFIKRYYSKKQLAAIWNFVTTDAHREVISEGIGKLIH